ncbi:putative F-box protein At3g52320 [Papaver somniferum]|uniref:putative F-box protein At3g52320 n=1 Tax=Papaver somniferum TaxID=3469 RepID=UPI000E6F568B|nr:putative F-box protein At3g52320 [Papaver somniferum]
MISTLNSSTEDFVDLPTDVFHDIFLRLPYKYVYKFRCVSKVWLTLLSDASLVKKVFKTTTSILNQSPASHIQLFQASTSQKLHHESHNEFCFNLLKDSSIWRLRLLASCNNGLVLYSTRRWRCYYVFNPLTKQRVSLPRRPKQDMGNVGYTRLVSEYSVNNLTCNYKVIFIPVFVSDAGYFSFQIFSSQTGAWNIHNIQGSKGIFTCYSDMIIRSGVLYWTDEDGGSNQHIIRAYNLKTFQCERIELPTNWPIYKKLDGFFGKSEGSIYYGHIDQTRDMPDFLSVWVLEEDHTNGGWVWQLVHHNIELEGHVSSEKVGGMLKYFNPVDRNVVIFASDSFCLAYNIGTGTFEVLRSSSVPPFKTNITISSSPLPITPKSTLIPSLP